MTGQGVDAEEIKANELKALFFMDKAKTCTAEKILLKNMKHKTSSILTYDLLIGVYHKKQDYHSMIQVLNQGIKNTEKKMFYRKLKKQLIISQILADLEKL